MKRFMAFLEPGGDEYALVGRFMQEMEALRCMWGSFRPPAPLTRGDLVLLANIEHLRRGEEPVTASALAAQMEQTLPAISQKVTVLEKQGYLRRLQKKQDKRVWGIELTPKGEAAAQSALHMFYQRMQQAMERFGEEDARQLLCLMEKLRKCIQTMQEEDIG